MKYDYDWLVVGSGFGGSVSALRLAEKGYNPQYGARPLKRVIQDKILTPLASLMVSQGIGEGVARGFAAEGCHLHLCHAE